MKLKTLIINEAEIKRELFIGRELEILDEKVLLLALQEGTFCDDEGETEAAAKLVEELGGEVVKIVFIMELAGLNGRERLKDYDVASVIRYEGK